MKNSELRAILEARKAELQAHQEVLVTAADKLKPQGIDPDALKILNDMGLTVAPVSMPDNPHVEQLEGVAQNCEEAVARIEEALATLPTEGEAKFTMSEAMAWDVNTDPRIREMLGQ